MRVVEPIPTRICVPPASTAERGSMSAERSAIIVEWAAPFLCLLVFLVCALSSTTALAATKYTFSGTLNDATFPTCTSYGGWTVSGTTYTCGDAISLGNGDSILPAASITVSAHSGISLAGKNTVGSASVPVALQADYGTGITANGSGNTFYGSLTTSSGDITVGNASITGTVSSSSGAIALTSVTVTGSLNTNGVVTLSGGSVSGNVTGKNGVTTSKGTTIGGNVTANSGSISLAGGSVAGSVHSDCCTITTNDTDIGGSLSTTVISSNSNTVTIIGGTVSGTISTSGGSGIIIQNATVTSGSISATSVAIAISNSTIGSPGSTVNITGNNRVTLSNNTSVYGNVTAGNWSDALTIDSTSTVYGVCTSNNNSISNPAQYPRCAAAVVVVDHILLEISGTLLTCTPSTVIVKACANAACSALASSAVTVALGADNGGVWAASPLTVTGSATTTLKKTTSGTTTLTATGGNGATTCSVNGALQGNCQVAFADSALLLSVPTQTAGVTGSVTVSAVRKSNNSLDCVPAFASVTRNVKFWSSYLSPTTGSATPAVGGTSVANSAKTLAASTSSTGTALALSFDATGTAGATLQYDDAGQLALRARYDGSKANGDASLVLTGESNFVSVPYGLCVDSSDSGWNCVKGDATCAKYRKTGEAFTLRVTGKAYQSGTALCSMPTTANYQQNDVALSAKVVAPSGGADGALGTGKISITANGTATISDQTHSEVGVFTFTATPPSAAYFSQTVAPGTSASFGRFIPDHFAITAGTVAPACASNTPAFTYFGQDGFTTPFTLTAQNSASTTTSNYAGDFARLTPTLWSAYGFATKAALPGGSTLTAGSTAPTGSWVKGVASVSATHQISRPSAPAGETSVTLTALPKDSDGVTMAGAAAVHSAATPLRYGRLRLSNAFGSDRRDLAVPVEAQYWSGLSWVRNSADGCTTLPLAAVGLSGARGNTQVASAVKLASGGGNIVLTCPYATCPLTSKPATSLAGSVGVCVDLGADPSSDATKNVVCEKSSAALPYLQGKWPPGTTYANDPSASATFGVYSPETSRTVHVREAF